MKRTKQSDEELKILLKSAENASSKAIRTSRTMGLTVKFISTTKPSKFTSLTAKQEKTTLAQI